MMKNLDHYLEIRYEDLILNTIDTLKNVCKFIDLSWDSSILEYYKPAEDRLREIKMDIIPSNGDGVITAKERLAQYVMTANPPEPSRIGRWRKEMTVSERKSFEAIAGTMLRELGYDVD